MHRLLIVLALILASALPARADPAAVRDVITAQIDAFERDAFDEAFEYASPVIQHMFRTPERFGMMVMQGYPMVWRPEGYRFGLAEDRGNGRITQYVSFDDRAGRSYLAEYDMIEMEDGRWLINGVRLLPDTAVGA
ncbi:MAG: DUF4864 domain-containing protein [Rubricella sp.]